MLFSENYKFHLRCVLLLCPRASTGSVGSPQGDVGSADNQEQTHNALRPLHICHALSADREYFGRKFTYVALLNFVSVSVSVESTLLR